MDVKINRLDPNVPDPIESRRRAAGRLVRFSMQQSCSVCSVSSSSISARLLFISAGPAPSHPRDMWFRFPLPCRSTR